MQDCDPKRRERSELSLIIVLVFWLKAFFRLCCRKPHWVEENEFWNEKILGICKGGGWAEKELQKYAQNSPWVHWGQFLDCSTGKRGHRIQTEPSSLPEVKRMNSGVGEAKRTIIKIAEFPEMKISWNLHRDSLYLWLKISLTCKSWVNSQWLSKETLRK